MISQDSAYRVWREVFSPNTIGESYEDMAMIDLIMGRGHSLGSGAGWPRLKSPFFWVAPVGSLETLPGRREPEEVLAKWAVPKWPHVPRHTGRLPSEPTCVTQLGQAWPGF